MFSANTFVGIAVFAGAYLLVLWAGFRWALSRVNGIARDVAAALEKAGARVTAIRPTKRIWGRAEVDFELAGTRAQASVQQWGRDSQLVSLHTAAKPRPGVWIRRERGIDRMGKAVGFEHEVQTGDAEFDDAAYVAARAPEGVVRELLAPAEVRRVSLEIIQRGYSVFLSREGLRAATLSGFFSGFDESGLASMLELLGRLDAALPATDPSLAGDFQPPRSPVAVILPTMMASMLGIVVFAIVGRDVVHPPAAGGDVVVALLAGALLWFPAVYVAARALRNRPFGLFELVFVAIALLAAVPFLGAFALFAVNSGLDHAPAAHRRAAVVEYYRHNRHTVWVEGDSQGGSREKIIVPPSVPVVSVGDTLEYDAHPGALGWRWISDVRRAE